MAQLTTTDGRCIEGIWVPIEIWDSDLPPIEKILFIEIHSYTVDGKEISMSNEDVARYLGVTERWARQVINNVAKRNLIDIRFDGKNRWVKTRIVAGKNELKQSFGSGVHVVSRSVADREEEKFHPGRKNNSTLTPRVEEKFHPEWNNSSTLQSPPTPPSTTNLITNVTSVDDKKDKEENIIKEEKETFDTAYRNLFSKAYSSELWRGVQQRVHKINDWKLAYDRFRDHIIGQGREQELIGMQVERFKAWFNNSAIYFLGDNGGIELGPDEEITADGTRRCRYAGCWNNIPLDAPPRPEGQYVWSYKQHKWVHSDDVGYARKRH